MRWLIMVKIRVDISNQGGKSNSYDLNKDLERRLRREVSRLSSMANKRIDRLLAKNMKTPAIRNWLDGGGKRFGVQGKTYPEVVREFHRVNQYLDMQTSSLTGAKEVVKKLAKQVELDTGKMTQRELNVVIPKFFELANKAEQYFQNVKGGVQVSYKQIWSEINEVLDDSTNQAKLLDGEIDDLLDNVIEFMEVKNINVAKELANMGMDMYNEDFKL